MISTYESGQKVFIIDRRSEEDIAIYGPIENALRECEIDVIKKHLTDEYYLVAVINDLPLASQLVLESISRVVSVIVDKKIPRSMLIESNGTAR